jgi:signal transduction histidine kinase
VEAACLLLAKNNPAEADRQLQRLAEVIRDVHVDIRESIAGLRTEVATDRGLWQSLEEYIEWFSRNHDIDARLVIDKKFTAGMLSAATSAQLLRIIQEALTNIRKHAGAHHATVLVRQQQDTIEIRIKDDGRGFDLSLAEKKGCYGLRIMKERAEEAGAQLKIESVPFAGTTVIVSLPEKCG